MALHAALQREGSTPAPEPGLLVSVRDLTLDVARLDDIPAPLRITCEREAGSGSGSAWRFEVTGGDGTRVARGRALLMRGSPRPVAA
jgi:predicted hotdog family 3-hydroxylacyl-ACP dehydratase